MLQQRNPRQWLQQFRLLEGHCCNNVNPVIVATVRYNLIAATTQSKVIVGIGVSTQK
jgi:hypothetical protein